jgi:WD40 repeat protein
MTPAWRLATGSRTYLANDNSTRSIAWSPLTGNLLVASRSGGATNIYVLDGNTGAFLFTLQPPAGGYVGGTFTLNQVVVADDGTVYAGNLTDDGTTTNFKLYKWFGDFATEVGVPVWEGNPANDSARPLRWGDAMAVRGPSGAHEIILSSRTGALLSFILPDSLSVVTVDVSGAPANGFRLGLAAAPPDMVWGKITGSPLLQAQIDPNFTSGTIINSFSGLNNMGPIGVNPAGTLLAGVFIDNPDHLRLFDISTPGSIAALDTEFFPSDNANGNGTGGVAFGDHKVYALDSNNGLIVMNLNTDCLPDGLTIEHSGTDVILRWGRATYHLEGTTTLGSGWAPIAGGSPKTLPASGTQFFRLVCP